MRALSTLAAKADHRGALRSPCRERPGWIKVSSASRVPHRDNFPLTCKKSRPRWTTFRESGNSAPIGRRASSIVLADMRGAAVESSIILHFVGLYTTCTPLYTSIKLVSRQSVLLPLWSMTRQIIMRYGLPSPSLTLSGDLMIQRCMIRRYKFVAFTCTVLLFYPTFVACAADKKTLG